MARGTNMYRVVRHEKFEGLRGAYEVQWLNQNGDYENAAWFSTQEECANFISMAR